MQTLESLKQQIEDLKTQKQDNYAEIIGIDAKCISIINENFVSIKVDNMQDLKKALTNLEPFSNSQVIKHKETIYLNSYYLVQLINDYYRRELRIEFKGFNDIVFWITINMESLDNDFKDKYFVKGKRNLYNTETVYVNLPSHYKKFKEIRIDSYSFKDTQVSWYGGNRTLINEDTIKALIKELKE